MEKLYFYFIARTAALIWWIYVEAVQQSFDN